ncbi:hypothetical protein N0V90_006714 [Kalmusia sp. IMI 367209]|nr:hypothetical protein N0V90_006714 [Kalmusia sp. IMI 367209]
MKTFAPALFVALAGVATAQLPDLPQCSLSCFVTALGSDGCAELTDFKCHCQKSDSLLSSVTPCVQSACSADEQAEVIKGVEDTCASAGVTISVPSPSASAAPESSAAESSEAPSSTEAEATSSAAATPAESTAAGYSSAVESSSVSAMPTPSSNGTVPTAAPTPSTSEFPGAAARVGQAAGVIGAAAVAFFAL